MKSFFLTALFCMLVFLTPLSIAMAEEEELLKSSNETAALEVSYEQESDTWWCLVEGDEIKQQLPMPSTITEPSSTEPSSTEPSSTEPSQTETDKQPPASTDFFETQFIAVDDDNQIYGLWISLNDAEASDKRRSFIRSPRHLVRAEFDVQTQTWSELTTVFSDAITRPLSHPDKPGELLMAYPSCGIFISAHSIDFGKTWTAMNYYRLDKDDPTRKQLEEKYMELIKDWNGVVYASFYPPKQQKK